MSTQTNMIPVDLPWRLGYFAAKWRCWMLREKRQQEILEELERAGSVSVAALSQELGVSDMTVRRDLEELSARNMLRKVHGGAGPGPKTPPEPHLVQKQRVKPAGKRAIARAA